MNGSHLLSRGHPPGLLRPAPVRFPSSRPARATVVFHVGLRNFLTP